jgi:hypothetical protein
MKIFLAFAFAALLASSANAQTPTSKTGIPASHVPYMGAIQLPASTVAQLPVCDAQHIGVLRTVTDATTPTFNATAVGGGAVRVPVHCNGTNWTTP